MLKHLSPGPQHFSAAAMAHGVCLSGAMPRQCRVTQSGESTGKIFGKKLQLSEPQGPALPHSARELGGFTLPWSCLTVSAITATTCGVQIWDTTKPVWTLVLEHLFHWGIWSHVREMFGHADCTHEVTRGLQPGLWAWCLEPEAGGAALDAFA